MKKISFIIFLLFTFSVKGYCQEKLDLGFEDGAVKWRVTDRNKNVSLLKDTIHAEGKYSLRIKPSGKPNLLVYVPVDFIGHKGTVEVSYSMCKSQSKVDIPQLFLQFANRDIRIEEMKTESEANGWIHCRMNVDIANPIGDGYVGFMYYGEEDIWIDDFKIKINGIDVESLKSVVYAKIDQDREFNNGSGINQIKIDKEKQERLFKLGKIWGLLKYYHPNIAGGGFNWDYELFRILPLALDEKKDFETEILKWIDRVGAITSNSNNIKRLENSIFNWISPKTIGPELSERLSGIVSGSNIVSNYYVGLLNSPTFDNENPYSSFDTPDCGYRLLSLFRTWNILEYFFPYKHLTIKNWDNVLKEYITQFVFADNKLEYGKTVCKFAAEIGDSHTFMAAGNNGLVLNELSLISDKTLSVFVENIEDQCVVVSCIEGRPIPFQPGDVITHLGGKRIKEEAERLKVFFSSSNENRYNNSIYDLLVRNINQDSIKVDWIREGKKYSQYVTASNKQPYTTEEKVPFRHIKENIGYIDAAKLYRNQCDSIMSIFKNKSGIIIDLRCYPNGVNYLLGEYLMPQPTDFVKFKQGSVKTPGIYDWSPNMTIGKNNPDYFKGIIVLLVNYKTGSHAEFTTMGWHVAPKAFVIGSQTAGADGDVTSFTIPGGYKITFSGLGVYYPDGGETQRVGVRIDEIVKPTIKGIREGRDEILERAVEIINSK